jgi:hypothetical protein
MTKRTWGTKGIESFQYWQGEFLAIGRMVVLSISLLQKRSPESTPVDAHIGKRGVDR